MKLISPLFFALTSTFLSTAVDAAMPKSEILLADLDTPYGMKVSRITDDTSYNNQPFLIDQGVYYTHEVIAEQGQSQTALYYFDFETYQQAIPEFNGIRPFQQIPFQYSPWFLNPEH